MMDELNISNPSELDDTSLIDIYRKYYPESQAKFCKPRMLNKANFSRWLVGKKASPASRSAVVEWIEEHQGITPAERLECITTFSDVEEEVINTTGEVIIFIDGDNSMGVLRRFLRSPQSVRSRIHVILILKINTRSLLANHCKKQSWITVLYSDTDCRDGADIAIAVRSTFMHLIEYSFECTFHVRLCRSFHH